MHELLLIETSLTAAPAIRKITAQKVLMAKQLQRVMLRLIAGTITITRSAIARSMNRIPKK